MTTHVSVLFLVLGIFSKGVSAVIRTQQTVVAAVGEQACLKCHLTQSKDVRQVTWQKVLPDGEKNLATYSKKFGARVNADLNEKVDFQYSELRNCSMVIKKVTEEDEGCYRCLFNTFPDGAVTGRTCLKLYELHEPVLHVRASDSAESVVSCSATGRPVPTVTLTVTQQHLNFSHHNTVKVNNTNGTVTVTATAVLSGFRDNSTQVGCAACVLSGPQLEVFEVIPEPKQTSDDDIPEKPQSDDRDFNATWIILFVVGVLIACCIAAMIALYLKQKHKNGDLERSKTPQKTTRQDSDQINTPLMTVNELRQRTSTKKSPENNRPKPSPSTAKRLFLQHNSLGEADYQTVEKSFDA